MSTDSDGSHDDGGDEEFDRLVQAVKRELEDDDSFGGRGVGRRTVLGALSGLAGGALLSQNAEAAGESWSSASGTVGTDGQPLSASNVSDLDVQQLGVVDTATSPAAAGEVRQNAGDVEVFSGGSVRNLSNIGSGGGGSGAGDVATVTVAASSSSYSADYTCDGTDDQNTINNAINALPAGGGTVVLTEGTYNISGAVTDQGKNGVWLRGQGDATLLQLGAVQANVIEFTSVDDTIISDLRINGNGANVSDGGNRENQCGIYGTALDRCLIQNVSIIDTYYSNIRIGDGGSTVYGLTVADCHLETTRGGTDNVADGISTLGRQGGTFERIILRDNYIIDTNHDFVEISSGNDIVHIENNICYSERAAAGGIGPHPGTAGTESEATDEIVITGNYVSLPNLDGTSGSVGGINANCRQMTVVGNIVQDVGSTGTNFNGIHVDSTHSTNGGPSVIVGNMVDNVTGEGIYAAGEDCTVVGNSVQGSGNYGINVGGNGAREAIVGNTVNGSGSGAYTVASGASDIVFEGNQPRKMAASGQVTLSGGTGVVDTGISATDATFMLALGIDDPGADAKVAGQLFWDDSAGTYKVEIDEVETSVGNPTVNYDVKRVR